MNVSLTPKPEALVRAKVESGMYNNASEVIREALRIMEREEKKRILLDALQAGIDQLERGEGIEYTDSTMAEIFERAQKTLAAGHKVNDLVMP